MIELPFDPNVHFGPITLAWHGIFTAVGILFGVALPVRLLRGRVREDDAYAVATWGVVGGIAGARVVHVVDCWSACGYDANPLTIFALLSGGIAIWGAIIGGILAGFAVALRRHFPIGLGADAAAPGIGLGMAIGRIGDIINGEHHAALCGDGPGICVVYTDPTTLGQGPSFVPGDPRFAAGAVHLAVGYEMAWDLIGVGLALLARRWALGRPQQGLILWGWLLFYAVGRFFISLLRQGEPTYLFALREDQLISLGAIAVAVPALLVLGERVRRGPGRAVPDEAIA